MPGQADLRERLGALDILPRELPRSKVFDAQRAWLQVFAQELKNATGKWVYRDHYWSTFSLGHTPCRMGDAARHLYAEVAPEDLLFVSGWTKKDFGFQASSQAPTLDIGLDLLVFPWPDLTWTMAYTHEEDIGPFFALAEDCSGYFVAHDGNVRR